MVSEASIQLLVAMYVPTYLVPDHVGKCAYELWCGVAIPLQGLLVDHFADGEPERGFEAL